MREQPLCGARGRHLPLRRDAALQDQFQHLGPDARAARAERRTEIRGSFGEISGSHVSLATALWLQTMVPLTAGDTVELQGISGSQDGYFRGRPHVPLGLKIG